jgi:putative ABC transport system permease protein
MIRRLRAWSRRLTGLVTGPRRDRDFADELESHLQLHIDDNIRAGMSSSEARRHALIRLGGIDQAREAHRDRRGIPAIENLVRDLRHGIRGLVKSPGFTVAAITVLGLGVGVNTAIFTIVNTVVLRPLPFAESDRLMRVWHTPPPQLFAGHPTFPLSPANFVDWQEQSQSFEAMAAYMFRRVTLTGVGEPESLIAGQVSSEFLPILGLQPILGRNFTPSDDREGAPATVLLSEGTWRSRFGADPSIVGRVVTLDGVSRTVVGVAPSAATFINRIQLWMPLAWSAEERAVRDNHNYRVIARLRSDVDLARAQADLSAIAARLEQQYPADNKGWGAMVVPLHQDLVGDVRAALLVLLGAVGLVLLIACANVANLLLVRTFGRGKEIAMRSALGASRARVVQQLLVEGLLLGVGGGLAGLVAAVAGVRVLVAAFGDTLPRAAEVSIDGRVLAFTAAAAVLTGVVTAAAPAWQLTRRDLNDALKSGAGRGSSSGGEGRVRRLLVVSEVALALMLLVGAGLLMRSLVVLQSSDRGFDPHNLLTAVVQLPEAKYPTEEDRDRFFDAVLNRIRSLPGVESAGTVDTLPLHGGSTQPVAIEGAPVVPQSEQPALLVRLASADYFRTTRIPLLEGRDFERRDTRDGTLVAVISAEVARRFWPGESPIGKRLALPLISDEPRQVVGVVGEIKTEAIDARDPEATIYVPVSQLRPRGADLMVRTLVPPTELARPVVDAVHSVDPDQPVLEVSTMEDVVDDVLGRRRFAVQLLGAFAALALVLAAIGIYSVLAYTVRQRVREIGIRMALGAPASGVLRLIVADGLKPTVLGVFIGLALAAALGRVMESLLYGVGVHDTITYAGVAAVVTTVGAMATLVPAYRATRVDPVKTLRAE